MSFSPATARHSPGSARPTAGEMAVAALLENRYAKLALWAALLLLLVSPQYFSGFWAVDYNFWPQTVFLLSTTAVCGLLMVSGLHLGRFQLTDWLVAAFSGWCFLSALTTTYWHDSLLEIARIAGLATLYFALRTLLSRLPRPRLAATVLAVMTAGMTFVALQVVWNYGRNHDPRQFGTFFNPNLLANALAMTLAPAAATLVLTRRRGTPSLTVLAGLQLLFLLAALFFTSSKGGLLAAGSSIIIFLAALLRARGREGWLQVRKFWPLALLILVLAGALAVKTILPRLNTQFNHGDYSTLFRYYTWQGTLRMAASRPLLGYGPASFPAVYPQFAETGFTRSAHQLWLQLAAESGFPALLLLAAACASAAVSSWKQLKSPDWPLKAAALGSLTAFAVHGLTDAGWGITSIGVICVTALAIGVTQPPHDITTEDLRPGLQPSWLALTLLVLAGAYGTQRAAIAEDTHVNAEVMIEKGATFVAVQTAQEAVDTDPLSARIRIGLASALVMNGQERAAEAAYRQAVALQPRRAASWLSLARMEDRLGEAKQAAANFDQAVALDPNDTSIRLERAEWYLQNNEDKRAFDDLQFIIAQRNRPYGRYAATPEFVNVDYARATVLLVPHLRATGQSSKARRLVETALEEVQRAKQSQALHEQMMRDLGPGSALRPEKDLDQLQLRLSNFQAFLAEAAQTKNP